MNKKLTSLMNKSIINAPFPRAVNDYSIQFEKDRLLVLNSPIPGDSILQRIYFAIKRTLIEIRPASYYYNKAMAIKERED